MISMSTSSEGPDSKAEPQGEPNPPVSRSDIEMERLRQLIIGDQVERVEERVADISRQVTNRDARVRRLVEDIPAALSKNSVDQSSLERLAMALRSPMEEALHQSVRSDRQKVAEILAPAVGQALPRALLSFVINIPLRLARRVWRVIWPKSGSTRSGAAAGLMARGATRDDQPFQVERLCLFRRDSLEVLRLSDLGFDDDTMELQVDHLFAQLREALMREDENPSAGLQYPQLPGRKAQRQGVLVLSSDRTILAAYYVGQPAAWLRDRLQDLADEADGHACTIIELAEAGNAAVQQLQALDGILKKGLVCYVPQTGKANRHALGHLVAGCRRRRGRHRRGVAGRVAGPLVHPME